LSSFSWFTFVALPVLLLKSPLDRACLHTELTRNCLKINPRVLDP
jgi:hypothetical protein